MKTNEAHDEYFKPITIRLNSVSGVSSQSDGEIEAADAKRWLYVASQWQKYADRMIVEKLGRLDSGE